jgi:calpain
VFFLFHSSPEWDSIDDETKEELGLCFDADGEFWMCYEDFIKHFDRLEFCNLSPDSLDQEYGKTKWSTSILEGSWIPGQTAGGCRNYIG